MILPLGTVNVGSGQESPQRVGNDEVLVVKAGAEEPLLVYDGMGSLIEIMMLIGGTMIVPLGRVGYGPRLEVDPREVGPTMTELDGAETGNEGLVNVSQDPPLTDIVVG